MRPPALVSAFTPSLKHSTGACAVQKTMFCFSDTEPTWQSGPARQVILTCTSFCRSWLYPVLLLSDVDLLRTAGLDALVRPADAAGHATGRVCKVVCTCTAWHRIAFSVDPGAHPPLHTSAQCHGAAHASFGTCSQRMADGARPLCCHVQCSAAPGPAFMLSQNALARNCARASDVGHA